MKGDSCTDENPHWFPPFYGNWSDSTQGSFLTKWEGLRDKIAANLRRMELANILSEWIQKSSRESMPPDPPPPPPTRSLHLWRLFKKYISIYPTPIAAYHTSYTWGLFFPQPSNYVYWGNYGKEVLHFVTQSDNVVLNKQGFW